MTEPLLPGVPVPRGANARGGDPAETLFLAALFRGLPTYITLKTAEVGHVRDLADDDRLLRPGEQNDAIYVVLMGTLEVRLDGLGFDKPVVVGPGETLGELSIVDGEPASAEVVAVGPARVLEIPEDFFWAMLAPNQTFARNLARLLASRTRASNERVIARMKEHLAFEHLQRELGIARTIQLGMLPGRGVLFPGHPSVEVFSRMDPARDIGGDLYDAFFLRPDCLAAAIGDVSGKGVPAALFMAKAVAQLRLVALSETSPAAIVARWNNLLCEFNEAGMFVTLVFVVLDLNTGTAVYSNAGHPPLVLLGAGGARPLPMPRGLVAGVQPDAVYAEQEVVLAPGECLLLYTDGVTEAESPDGTLYGEDRLLLEIGRARPDDAEGLVREVSASVAKHAAGAPQSDDITLLAIRRRPVAP